MTTTLEDDSGGAARPRQDTCDEEPASLEHATGEITTNDAIMKKGVPDRSLLDEDDDEDELFENEAQGRTDKDKSATYDDVLSRALVGENVEGISPGTLSFTSTTAAANVSIAKQQRELRLAVHAHTWDGFVRQGTRLKTFLDDTMQKVRDSFPGGEKRPLLAGSEDGDGQEPPRQRRRVGELDHTADLAREKTAEVMQLQRQLKDAQVQASALKAANQALREESASTQQRMEHTAESLRIAGANAQKARVDADAAEATAASLSQTLQSLQTVVDETKRASQVLHKEHQEISSTAKSFEGKLLQKEGDLARAHKELKLLRESNSNLEHSHKLWKEERERLERNVERQTQELENMKRVQSEREAMERARKERADKVEQEWRQAQALLVEATAGQTQAEQTKATLEETVNDLRKANEEVHERLARQQTTSRKDHERLSEALAKAEKEAQQLRIEAEATEEVLQRLRLDKQTTDKQITELKTRATSAERRLKELTNRSTVSPDPNSAALIPASATPAPGRSYHLPPLSGNNKSTAVNKDSTPSAKVTSGKVCSICFKAPMGVMKSCQCGNPSCRLRAHMSCANRIQPGPSVSHPGTPAPRLPIRLCGPTAAPLGK